MKRYIQYGSGFSCPERWINYDASPTLKLERIFLIGNLISKNENRFPSNVIYGDITKNFPEKENSCDGVFCSHVLEHLSLEDFRISLKTTYKILKPGGVFRCVLPDLKSAAERYIENYNTDSSSSIKFMEETMLGVHQRNKGFINIIINHFGNSKHLWMWDEKSLIKELKLAGFREIRPCKYNDSIDKNFNDVEDESRFQQAVAIESIK